MYAPKASLEIGRSIGDAASPALTDAEARCLGGGAIDLLGLDVIFELSFSETPTDEQFLQVLTATLRAVDQCGLTLKRLGV